MKASRPSQPKASRPSQPKVSSRLRPPRASRAKPAEGEQAKPAEGEQAKPAEGEQQTQTAEGEQAKPAEGEQAKPADGEQAKPAEGAKPYQPDYAKLLKDSVDEIKRENRDVIDRLVKAGTGEKPKQQTVESVAAKVLEGLSADEIKQTLQKVRDADPETADAMEGLVGKMTGAVSSLAKDVDTLRVGRTADAAQAQVSARETTIEAKHPGFRELVGSADGKTGPKAEFTAWFNKQPAYMKDVAKNTDDPEVFSSILDKYKTETAEAGKSGNGEAKQQQQQAGPSEAEKAKNQAQLRAASPPNTRESPARAAPGKRSLSDDEEWMQGWNAGEKD